jgi:peptidoglycan/xylan/chitin deacetylase (PgdA/CDA1 family)
MICLAKRVLPAGTGVWLRSVFGPLILKGPITRSLPAGSEATALTFDDGPHPEYTPRVLRLLDQWGIKATFFSIGREAERYPDLLRQIHAAGHEIGNHTQTHPDRLREFSTAQVVDEIRHGNRSLAAITGTTPRYFRPPFGTVTFPILWACRLTAMRPVWWSHDSLDYSDHPLTANTFVEAARPGQIMLFHDNRDACPALLEVVLPMLVKRGYRFAPLGQAL